MKKSLVLAVVLIGTMLPMDLVRAQGTQIRFLNPSPHFQGDPVEITDNQTLHLVAWVQQVPASPFVEFELEAVDEGPLGGSGATTVDGERVGSSDTWDQEFAIPGSLLEGEYELRARVYSGTEEVAATEQIVTLDRAAAPPATEAVTIDVPENGGQLGFYVPPAKRPTAVIEVEATSGTDQVRVLYTKTAPGVQPAWLGCGAERPDPDTRIALARCTLREGDSPGQVTAVAAVANNTPYPGDPQPAADDASDAIRITPYLQIPTTVAFEREAGYEVDENACQDFKFLVSDQAGRPIAGANVDMHAQGPTDQLKFATNDVENPILPTNDPYQKPEKAHTSEERAYRCRDGRNAEESQGDHNVIGGADRKHVESIAGTNNDGSFTFTLFNATEGGTVVTAWVDGEDDDNQNTSEAVGFGRIGWGEDPPPPPRNIIIDPDDETPEQNTCLRVILQARQGNDLLVGANVDIHIKGPDANVSFCSPPDASAGRVPDTGGHSNDAHEDGTKHFEGETDGNGNFIFGITSANEGGTDIGGWVEDNDDDAFAPTEAGNSASVFWGGKDAQVVGSRVTINYRNGAFKGRVRASTPGCRRGRVVTVKRRKSGSDPTIGKDRTNKRGVYKLREPGVRGTFYASVRRKRYSFDGTTYTCRPARSGRIRVR